MKTSPAIKKFRLLGGHPSLDFANTVSGWGSNATRRGARDYRDAITVDKLSGYDDLVGWSLHSGLIGEKEAGRLLRLAEGRPGAAQAAYQRAVKLRQSIYRLFRSVVEGWQPDPADVEKLNEELRIAGRHEELARTRDGFDWKWRDGGASLDCMLWQLARSAAALLTSGDLSRLRQCGGERCGWLFLDTSRNRSRQWCDMKDCGNLAKVRRFRQRQRSAAR